jgi:phenylpropionate dioxygenase-like ring-hydroxylating dioxygenase large terminal subunit
MPEQPLFLRNIWYLGMHGSKLPQRKLVSKQILGEMVVFGRDADGKPFALRDHCPHRGVPLSHGWFDGKTVQCCYHGWEFDCKGICINIPALAPGHPINLGKIKAFAYPCEEINGTIWVYMPEKKVSPCNPKIPPPDLQLAANGLYRHVESVVLPCNIDHSVIGLIDPAHVTFVHQSWFWRSKKSLRIKEKHFEPTAMGFKMARHEPSTNSKGYKMLKGGSSTEIIFEIPGVRLEHILVGGKNEIISVTTLTPLNENETELNHFFYTSLGIVNFIWWPLKTLGKKFISQDLDIFIKLREGLNKNPKLMLVGDPDTQARWYYDLKKQWQQAQEDNTPFQNRMMAQTLRWVT